MTIAILSTATALFGLLTTLLTTKVKPVQHDNDLVERIVREHQEAQRAAEPVMVEMPKPSRWRVR